MMWLVVDKDGTTIFTFHSENRAVAEAEVLNETGLPEYRPYRVTREAEPPPG